MFWSKPTPWLAALAALLSVPLLLLATSSGGPAGRTGAFGELGCDGSGCHRSEPGGPGGGRVFIDVGPYIPGQLQRVRVTVFDAGARRWGFELAAREARDPQRQAGTLAAAPDDPFVQVRCAGGTTPPCGGQLQYATHTSLGSRDNSPSRFSSYRVDWTPPPDNVGDVIFTAAGLGADGDRGTNGDHAYTATMLSVYGPGNQPVLRDNGVVNAASFAAPDSAITQGSLVTLLGDKLSPPGFAREVTRVELPEGILPTELNRIGADVLVPGIDPVPAYVLAVSPRQMDIQVPALRLGFNGFVEFQPVFNRGQGANEIRGNKISVHVQDIAPGLFTTDGKKVLVAETAATFSPPTLGRGGLFPTFRPLHSGDVITIYGTGFGLTRPQIEPGRIGSDFAPLANQINVRIGDRFLGPDEVLYAGATPALAGIQQFTLRIPPGVGGGDLPIVFSVRGLESQPGVVLATGKVYESWQH